LKTPWNCLRLNSAIGRKISISPLTIRRWRRRAQEHGVDELPGSIAGINKAKQTSHPVAAGMIVPDVFSLTQCSSGMVAHQETSVSVGITAYCRID
jgi:hypothetical protein